MQKYYTYAYLDPRKPGRFCYEGVDVCFLFEPFYVGKGSKRRAFQHILDAKRTTIQSPRLNKIRKILEQNNLPIVCIICKDLTEESSYILEESLISSIGRQNLYKGPLLNLSDGGDGPVGVIRKPLSYETRQKISKAHKNKIVTSSTRALMSKIRQGTSRTDVTKAKIAAASAKRVRHASERAKTSATLTGRKHSIERKNAVAASRRNSPHFKKVTFIDPSGQQYHTEGGEFQRFIYEKGFFPASFYTSLAHNGSVISKGIAKGWRCILTA